MNDDGSHEAGYDFRERDYLLPEGCKDLVDVLNSKVQKHPFASEVPLDLDGLKRHVAEQFELFVSGKVALEPMTVRELAAVIRVKPFRIIKDLMKLDVFAHPDLTLDSETLRQLLRLYFGNTTGESTG